jgi:hypothetical protein
VKIISKKFSTGQVRLLVFVQSLNIERSAMWGKGLRRIISHSATAERLTLG